MESVCEWPEGWGHSDHESDHGSDWWVGGGGGVGLDSSEVWNLYTSYSLSDLWRDKPITFLCLQKKLHKKTHKEIKAVVRNSCQISMSYSFSWFGNISWPQQLAWLIPCWRELSNASTVPSKLKGQLKQTKAPSEKDFAFFYFPRDE